MLKKNVTRRPETCGVNYTYWKSLFLEGMDVFGNPCHCIFVDPISSV